jgi:hypothetical protein
MPHFEKKRVFNETQHSLSTFTFNTQSATYRNDRKMVHTPTLAHTHTKSVCEHEAVTGLWNQWKRTQKELTANRQDIISKNKEEKTCILIDVAIPADRNITQREAERKLKYSSSCIEI